MTSDPEDLNLPLNPLRAFAVAARFPTFTAAAMHMGISQVAISRQISVLEGQLGIKLFERSPRSVTLTEAGRAFGHEIARLYDELEDATERILSRERERTINLRIYPTLAHYWLLPRLASFKAAYPEYHIRLDTRIERLDFSGSHLDLAVQLGHGNWPGGRGRKLFDEAVDLVCSPAYAERHNGFRDPQERRRARLLRSRFRGPAWGSWMLASGLSFEETNGTTFDSSVLAYSAALQGQGLAIGQIPILEGEIAAGRLVRPFGVTAATGMAFYAVWPTDRSVRTKTRHFIDWLLEQTGNEPQFFRGQGAQLQKPDPSPPGQDRF